MLQYDFIIIGGGIIGLATCRALAEKFPDARIAVLEKEAGWAMHQTGRNSGVIHSGIYYKPGSLKARMATQGNRSMTAFCREHGIPFEPCGKLIVATRPEELPLLDNLYRRGLENGLSVSKQDADAIREREPHAQGLSGLLVPSTGIVSYQAVAATLAKQARVNLHINTRVHGIRKDGKTRIIRTTWGDFQTRFVINCAGLHSDRVATMAGTKPAGKIIPFKGEYYELKPEKRHLVKHMIYPVPNPNFPFLGVHFTRGIDGGVHIGPNAVLSLKREGYSKFAISLPDTMETFCFPGFWKLAARHMKAGGEEMLRSLYKQAFVREVRKMIPEIQAEDLVPTACGIRAQALAPSGALIDDFLIVQDETAIHVCNAPSPAATASLEIAGEIVSRIPTDVAHKSVWRPKAS